MPSYQAYISFFFWSLSLTFPGGPLFLSLESAYLKFLQLATQIGRISKRLVRCKGELVGNKFFHLKMNKKPCEYPLILHRDSRGTFTYIYIYSCPRHPLTSSISRTKVKWMCESCNRLHRVARASVKACRRDTNSSLGRRKKNEGPLSSPPCIYIYIYYRPLESEKVMNWKETPTDLILMKVACSLWSLSIAKSHCCWRDCILLSRTALARERFSVSTWWAIESVVCLYAYSVFSLLLLSFPFLLGFFFFFRTMKNDQDRSRISQWGKPPI